MPRVVIHSQSGKILCLWDHEISPLLLYSDRSDSVSTKTAFNLFITHGNREDSFVEVTIHRPIWFLGMIYCMLC
jgi:hypothetical protein